MLAAKPAERRGDAPGVAQVVVDVQGDEPGSWVRAGAGGAGVPLSVDILPLVHERVDLAVVGLLQQASSASHRSGAKS